MATAKLFAPKTPSTYHRIVSDKLKIPSDIRVPIPVGLIACQRDPLLRTLETFVVSSAIHKPQTSNDSSGKKNAKKAVIAPTLPKDPILEIVLHDTIVFPEGGGQPTDTGEITTSDGHVWEVVQCKRHGGHPVHYVRVQGSSVEDAQAAFTPARNVTVSLNDKDYDRRLDHMHIHTSQHLLSAVLEKELALPTLSWSLTTYPSPCYVEVPRGMSQEEIAMIQDKANRLVFEGREVHVEVEELDRAVEKGVEVLESGRAVGKALPQDYTGGVKRTVVIEQVDRNPCCGTHLPSISNLQLFLIPHTEGLSRSSTTSARLYFLSGPRLINHLTTTHSLLSQTSTVLSCGLPVVPERVSQVVDERRRCDKRAGDLEGELANIIADDLLKELSSSEGGVFKKHIHRTDDSSSCLSFLSSISFAFGDKVSSSQGIENKAYLIVFSSSPSAQSTNSTSVVVAFGSDEKQVKAMGGVLKSQGIKGGGKGPKWSGKYVGVWKDKNGAAVEEALMTVD